MYEKIRLTGRWQFLLGLCEAIPDIGVEGSSMLSSLDSLRGTEQFGTLSICKKGIVSCMIMHFCSHSMEILYRGNILVEMYPECQRHTKRFFGTTSLSDCRLESSSVSSTILSFESIRGSEKSATPITCKKGLSISRYVIHFGLHSIKTSHRGRTFEPFIETAAF